MYETCNTPTCQAKLTDVTMRFHELATENSRLRSEIPRLREKDEKIHYLNAQLEKSNEITKQLQETELKYNTGKREFEKLRVQMRELTFIAASAQEIQSQYEIANRSAKTYKVQNEALHGEVKNLQDIILRKTQESDDTFTENTQQAKLLCKTTTEGERLSTENAALQNDVCDLREVIHHKNKEQDAMTIRTESEITHLETEINNLRTELELYQNSDVEQLISNLKNECSDLRQQLVITTTSLHQLRNDIFKKEELSTQLVAKLEASQFILEARNEEIGSLRDEINPLGEMLGTKTQQLAQASEELKQLRNQKCSPSSTERSEIAELERENRILLERLNSQPAVSNRSTELLLGNMTHDNESLKNLIHDHMKKITSLEEENQQTKQQLNNNSQKTLILESKYQEASRECIYLKDMLVVMNTRNCQPIGKQESEHIEIENEVLKLELQEIQSVATNSQHRIRELQKELSNLKEQLSCNDDFQPSEGDINDDGFQLPVDSAASSNIQPLQTTESTYCDPSEDGTPLDDPTIVTKHTDLFQTTESTHCDPSEDGTPLDDKKTTTITNSSPISVDFGLKEMDSTSNPNISPLHVTPVSSVRSSTEDYPESQNDHEIGREINRILENSRRNESEPDVSEQCVIEKKQDYVKVDALEAEHRKLQHAIQELQPYSVPEIDSSESQSLLTPRNNNTKELPDEQVPNKDWDQQIRRVAMMQHVVIS